MDEQVASLVSKSRTGRVRKPSAILTDEDSLIMMPHKPSPLPRDGGRCVSKKEQAERAERAERVREWKADREKNGIRCGSFTPEEDEAVMTAMKTLGKTSWRKITEFGKINRTPKAVRERYANHLHPDIDKSKFTAEEDAYILEMYELHGSCWAKIARDFGNRTDNQVKNRFNVALRAKAGPLAQPLAQHGGAAPKELPVEDALCKMFEWHEGVLDNLQLPDTLEEHDFLSELAELGPLPTALPVMKQIEIGKELNLPVARPPEAPTAPTAPTSGKPGLNIRTVQKVNFKHGKRGFVGVMPGNFKRFNVNYKKACYRQQRD